MGRAGPQSSALKAAREALIGRGRRLPWDRKGLTRADRMLAFLEWLPVTKGVKAGKRMRLLPGQRRFVEQLYRVDGKGRRATRLAVRSEPRGNGKSGLLAGICLGHLLGPEAERRGEIYSAAIDRQQAGILFSEMEAIIVQVPEFAARVNVQRFTKKIEVLSGPGVGSVYEALSADARRAHGLSPSLWCFDELAQVQSPELLENLRTAMGKRAESLGIVISTQAPNDTHVLSRLIDDGLTHVDPSILIDLTCVPQEADPFDLATLLKANPAAGIFLDRQTLQDELEQARRIPAFESRFRNLRANQRADANPEARIVTAQTWRRGNVPVDRAALAGRKCFAGLDLSAKHDLTALSLVFPSDDDDGPFSILPFAWTPIDQLGARRPAEQERFREWIAAGHLTAIPGPTIRYRYIADTMGRLAREFDIQAVAFDRWRIDDFKADLADLDTEFPAPLEAFGQGFASMSPAIEWFVELCLTGRLHHGGHPVLTASVVSAITISDPAGNLKIDKPKSEARGPVRIDVAVATIMALSIAKRFQAEPRADVGDFLSNMVWA